MMLFRNATPIAATLALSLALASCLCPPCPEGQGAASPTAAGGDQGGATASVAAGGRLVIWDGEGAGSGAQPWSDCDKKPKCKASLAATPGAGVDASNGLKFHGEGPGGWTGMGWNWFGWYPETAGIDISPYSNFTFQIRVENASPDTALSPDAITMLLGCSKGKQTSADVSPIKFEKDFADGKWHKVSIPMGEFVKGKAAAFDLKTAWEFRLSAWSATPVNFTIYVDQIAVEKQ